MHKRGGALRDHFVNLYSDKSLPLGHDQWNESIAHWQSIKHPERSHSIRFLAS
jgi:hypothetical protein